MSISKNRIASESFIYLTFDVLNKGVPFLLLPILTRYLGPDEYGIIAMFMTFLSLAIIFTGINSQGIISVNFFRKEKEELKLFIGNSLITLTVTTALTFSIVFLFLEFLSDLLHLPKSWLLLGVLVSGSHFVTGVTLAIWQAEHKPKNYGSFQFAEMLLNYSLSIFFIIILKEGWSGRIKGYSIAVILFSGLALFLIFRKKYTILKFHYPHIKEIIKFGIPLIPHLIASWARINIDRILITRFVNLGSTGMYYVGFQVGMVVDFLGAAFLKAYSPHLYKNLSTINEYKKKQIAKHNYIYFLTILLSSLLLGFLANKFLPLFLGTNFFGSASVVPWIALGFGFQACYRAVALFIFYEKNTSTLSWISITALLFHAAICYAMTKNSGILGAAQAFAISNLLIFILTWVLSIQSYKIPWFDIFKKH